MKEKIFDKLMKDEFYKQLIEQLPEDERILVIKALREITENFEKNIYEPLKNKLPSN